MKPAEPFCPWCGEPIGDHPIRHAEFPDTLKGYTWSCAYAPEENPEEDIG